MKKLLLISPLFVSLSSFAGNEKKPDFIMDAVYKPGTTNVVNKASTDVYEYGKGLFVRFIGCHLPQTTAAKDADVARASKELKNAQEKLTIKDGELNLEFKTKVIELMNEIDRLEALEKRTPEEDAKLNRCYKRLDVLERLTRKKVVSHAA